MASQRIKTSTVIPPKRRLENCVSVILTPLPALPDGRPLALRLCCRSHQGVWIQWRAHTCTNLVGRFMTSRCSLHLHLAMQAYSILQLSQQLCNRTFLEPLAIEWVPLAVNGLWSADAMGSDTNLLSWGAGK